MVMALSTGYASSVLYASAPLDLENTGDIMLIVATSLMSLNAILCGVLMGVVIKNLEVTGLGGQNCGTTAACDLSKAQAL